MTRRFLASALPAVLFLSLAGAAAPPPDNPHFAGRVSALLPAATRNTQPAAVRDEVDWNDVLATGPSGRLRAGLSDGSMLSLGAASQLTVVAHDAASQQTALQLLYGRVRSVVTPRTQPGGKFEIKTPTAVVGVIGTDFYVAASASSTTVLCYRGSVTVTGQGRDQRSVTLQAGQTVEVTLDAVGVPQVAASALLQETLSLTSVGVLLDLPAGTTVSATLAATLDSKKAKAGDAVAARVEENVKLEGAVVLPRKSRLVGHVTQAQARSKEAKESRLGVAWDRVELPSGEQVALDLVLQAVAAAPAPAYAANEASPFPAQQNVGTGAGDVPAGSGRMAGEAPVGPAGGVATAATSTVGAAARAAEPPVAGTVAGAADSTIAVPALDASGRLTARSQGAVNLPGMTLEPQASANGSLIVSSSGNVKLESGTQLMLRTAASGGR